MQQWISEICDSWWMAHDLKGLFSTIYVKATDWEYRRKTGRNPIAKGEHRTQVGGTREAHPHAGADLARPGARRDPNLLICETCVDTGTRISEVTGLMIKHVDLVRGCIRIEQRNWHGDIDSPKTESSKRTLALGSLVERYRTWIAGLRPIAPNAWVFPKRGDETSPVWDSGARQALKKAAKAEGLDFDGFGPHSLRRASITLRQEVGGTSIEASKIAGHSRISMTGEYTFVQLTRQDELTRKMQDLRNGATSEKPADAGADTVVVEPAA